jgi:S1-C subfamily serine protease
VAPGRRLLGIGALVGAAFAGAALALAGAVVLGAFDENDAAALGSTTVTVSRVAEDPVRGLAVTAGSTAPRLLTINEIYERAKSGVVQVNGRGGAALGSGFVLDKAGHVVTSHSVVAGASALSVSFSNRDRVPARVVGADRWTDVAVVKVEAKSVALTPLQLGDSNALRVGDLVVAIGNPFGLERTVTTGIVSALPARSGGEVDRAIRIDAPLGRGEAGGPLLNARGEVVGVNRASGLAVPIETVRSVAGQLLAGGLVRRAHLGVSVREVDIALADVFRLSADYGLLVQRVEPGSAAARAGVRGGTTKVVVAGESYTLGGDLVVAVDGQPVASLDDLRRALDGHRPGDEIVLELWRGEERRELEVKLGRQPRGG